MRGSRRGVASICFLLPLVATAARAQGTLSTQGLGYPPGQLSTRALASGGALAETDPVSPINPAALAAWGPASVYLQYEPEFRSVSSDEGGDRSTIWRFPLIAGAFHVRDRIVIGMAVSTLADNSWTTETRVRQLIADDSVDARLIYRSLGSIADIRLAASYALTHALRVGLGMHSITGEHRVSVSLVLPDSAIYQPFNDQFNREFSGIAASAGAEWRPTKSWSLAGSLRHGGTLRSSVENRLTARARVPDRVGASVRFDGLAGAALAAPLDWTGWSSLAPLGRTGLGARDALDVSLGADLAGPRYAGRVVRVRAGGRYRNLPFDAASSPVREISFGFGAGVPLAFQRTVVDVGLQRAARRSATADARETGWTLSLGVAVRP